MSNKNRLTTALFVLVCMSPVAALATGFSTDYQVRPETQLPEMQKGTSVDYSVQGGLTNIEANGSATDFTIAPIAVESSSSSSSSSTSSASATSSAESSSSSSRITSGGGGRGQATGVRGGEVPESSSIAGSSNVASSREKLRTAAPKSPEASGSASSWSVAKKESSVNSKSTTSVMISAEKEVSTNIVSADERPVLEFSVLEPGTYRFELMTIAGEALETRSITSTDTSLISAVQSTLAPGFYRVRIHNAEGVAIQEQIIEVLSPEVSPVFEIEVFAGKKADMNAQNPHDYGRIVRAEAQEIRGKTIPGARVSGYFRSKVRITRTIADTDGRYALPFPADLEDGPHEVTIVHTGEDGTILAHQEANFELVTIKANIRFFWIWAASQAAGLISLCIVTMHALGTRKKHGKGNRKNSPKTKQ